MRPHTPLTHFLTLPTHSPCLPLQSSVPLEAALTPAHTSSHLPHSPLKTLQGSVPPEVIQAAGAALSAKQQVAFQAYMAGQVPEAADE